MCFSQGSWFCNVAIHLCKVATGLMGYQILILKLKVVANEYKMTAG